MLARLVLVLGELDAAGLAAAADLHLRLDDAREADLLGGRDGLVDGPRRGARRAPGCRDGRRAACPGTRAGPWPAADSIRQRPRRRPMAECPAHGAPLRSTFVTFDVYGTLIDWEEGVYDAFRRRPSATASRSSDRRSSSPRFHEIEREIEGGSYELYAEVLRRIGRAHRQGARLAARALARGLPARLGRSAGRRSRRPTRSSRSSPRSSRPA